MSLHSHAFTANAMLALWSTPQINANATLVPFGSTQTQQWLALVPLVSPLFL